MNRRFMFQNKNRTKIKFASLLLAGAMSIPVLPLVRSGNAVRADGFTKSKENTKLSVTGINSPVAPVDADQAWSGNYVWYGKYDGSPMKFRVLDPSTARFSGDSGLNTMFLDSDKTIYRANFNSENNSIWNESPLRKNMNDKAFLNKENVFSDAERNAISESYISSHPLESGSANGQVCPWAVTRLKNYTALEGEKVFVLDVEDVSNGAYGYRVDEVAVNRVKTDTEGVVGKYWLRTGLPSGEEAACSVEDDGELNDLTVGAIFGIAPAMNVKHGSILLSTEVKAPNKSGYGGEYKLTLVDENIHFDIPARKIVTYEGRTIQIPYHYWGNSVSGARLSVLITSGALQDGNVNNANILYYGALKGVSGYTGTGTFELPEGLSIEDWGNKYFVYAFTEKQASGENALYESDYASTPLFIPDPVIPIDADHFEDENFRKYLLDTFDKDGSQSFTANEIKNVIRIDVIDKKISSLSGIKYFPELLELNCANNTISKLDVSNNTKLTTLNVYNNQLTSLDLENNPDINKLTTSANNIDVLDIHWCADLVDLAKNFTRTHLIDKPTNVPFYYYSGGGLLVINRTTQLILTDTPDPNDIPIDKEHFPDDNFRTAILEWVDTDSTKMLSTKEINKTKTMDLSRKSIADLTGLSYFTELTELVCEKNDLTSIDISKLTKLEYLSCAKNNLKTLVISENSALADLDCSENQLTSLDLSSSENLKFLSCYGNQISELDIRSCPLILTVVKTQEREEYSYENNPVHYRYYDDETDSGIFYDKSTVLETGIIQAPAKVTGLKAESSGKNRVKLSWNEVEGAEGYLVYAQKDNKYGYVGMTTKGTTFTDTKALDTDYNFYWVFAYVKDESGKMIPGGCEKYVYAKGVCLAVTNLKASSVTGGVKLTWTASAGAEGYLVYGIHPNGSYGYIGMTTLGTTFTDKKASKTDWNFYWVFPYHKNGNTMVVGGTPKYVYGKAK